MYTQLNDRILWYDGASSYSATNLASKMKQTRIKWVDKITPEVEVYNALVSASNQIRVKHECIPFESTWIGDVFDLYDEDVFEFVSIKHANISSRIHDIGEIEAREERLASELSLFYRDKELWNVLKCMVYVVNKLTVSKQVWGVGRGSSVSSYLLYVIGAHDVDSFKYDLDISDFITA